MRVGRSRLLPPLPAAEHARAHAVLAACPRIELRAGDGCGADRLAETELLAIEDGIALVARPSTGSARARMVLAVCGPGTLLAPPLPEERLVALTDAAVTAVPPDALSELLALPAAASAIAQGLLETLQERHESMAQLGRTPQAQRLQEKLIQLARLHGRVVRDGIRIDLPLTHELLAQTICSARETVTLALGDFERDGFLVREGGFYRLRVPPETLAS